MIRWSSFSARVNRTNIGVWSAKETTGELFLDEIGGTGMDGRGAGVVIDGDSILLEEREITVVTVDLVVDSDALVDETEDEAEGLDARIGAVGCARDLLESVLDYMSLRK